MIIVGYCLNHCMHLRISLHAYKWIFTFLTKIWIFALLESARVKVVCKYVGEIDPKLQGCQKICGTQCAKDCGPYNCACKYGHRHAYVKNNLWHIHTLVFMQLKLYFDVRALFFFLISKCEESSLPLKHANNYPINFFDYEGHNPWNTR